MSLPMEPTRERYAHPLPRYFAATRPAFLSATLMAGMLGLAAASHDGVRFDSGLALLAILAALTAHAAANVLNDYYDALNGTDALNTQRIFPFTGGSRFIQNGVLTPRETRDFGLLLMAAVAVAGLVLMWQAGVELLFFGVAGLFIGWAYSAPPLRLNSRGLGELCIAVAFLLIVAGADFVQRRMFAWTPWVAGLPYALLAANLLYINQFPDREADRAAGKLHWVARLPVQQARWGYLGIVLCAYLWLLAAVAGWGLTPWALLALAALPLSLKAAGGVLRHAAAPQQLTAAIKLTIAALLVHGALLALGLLLGKT